MAEMTDSNSKLPPQKKPGHFAKPGIWSHFNAQKLDGRTKLAKWIERKRASLLQELGGRDISPQQEILLDRVCLKSAKALLYELGVLTSSPNAMGSRDHYLALCNSLRLDLMALFPDGLKRQGKKVTDLNEYLKSKKEVQDGDD